MSSVNKYSTPLLWQAEKVGVKSQNNMNGLCKKGTYCVTGAYLVAGKSDAREQNLIIAGRV